VILLTLGVTKHDTSAELVLDIFVEIFKIKPMDSRKFIIEKLEREGFTYDPDFYFFENNIFQLSLYSEVATQKIFA
jgi:hypothetical protein